MAQLKNWRAKRAGGRITVYGEDAVTSQQVRITGVDKIEPSRDRGAVYCVATDKHGHTHHLLNG